MRILIIDSASSSAAYLARALREVGGLPDQAEDAATAQVMMADGDYDVAILNGFAVMETALEAVRRVRVQDETLPLIMLGRGDASERAKHLRAGCDDYLLFPYAFAELHARLARLVARRRPVMVAAGAVCTGSSPDAASTASGALGAHGQAAGASEMKGRGALTLDPTRCEALLEGQTLGLTQREFLLLQRLARQDGEIVRRDALIEAAWALDAEPTDYLLDRHIYRLRRKLDDRLRIEVVRGVGYRLV